MFLPNELSLIYLFISVAFLLAPRMTAHFFLNHSQVYIRFHILALSLLILGGILDLTWMAAIWPMFCVFGFILYLRQERWNIFSTLGLACCIPFVFSLISSVWFFSGANDLKLLGYNKTWSYYATLHGSMIGWLFVGCLAYISKGEKPPRANLIGCYLCFFLFLLVAFGINGVPYFKSVGVVGFTILIPSLIWNFTFNFKKERELSKYFALASLLSIIVSMSLAFLYEFWQGLPKLAFGMPLMTLTHGTINAILTVPCFYFAIRFATDAPAQKD